MTALALLLLLQAEVDLDQPHYLGYPAQDALQVAVTLEVAADGSFRGEAQYRFRMLEEAEAIYLDHTAAEEWTVKFQPGPHPRGGDPTMTVTRGAAKVRLARADPFLKDEEVNFSATFSGTPAAGLYRDRNRYGATFIYTDHFAARARGWLPLEDANTDRAQFTIELRLPPGWDALGSGDWQQLDEEGRHYRGTTQADIPPSLVAFAAGPFARVPEAGDPRLVAHYVFPQDAEAAAEVLIHHAAWMETMESTFGPYQYAKYTTAQIPTRWGGVEYPGNVWLSQTIFRGRDRGLGTLAHEFAHMWFGDAVGYADWQDAWLSEGFASYFGPWLQENIGGTPVGEHMRGTRDRWRRSKRAHAMPIRWTGWGEPDRMFGVASPNTYSKGALVLHMLRHEVGDDAFFDGIKAWYLAHLNQGVDSASLQAALEATAGRELAWFFSQWLDRPGAPVLGMDFADGELTLRQVQEGEAYRLPVEVAWTDAAGEEQRRTLDMDARVLRTILPEGASSPKLDPDAKLLYLAAD